MRLRRNHVTRDKETAGRLFRIGLIAAMILGLLFFLLKKDDTFSRFFREQKGTGPQAKEYTRTFEPVSNGQLIQKKSFSLSYNPKMKNPEWVAYHLTKEQLASTELTVKPLFLPDPEVKIGSNLHEAYNGSGFERGQLVPAADMSFDSIAFSETFLLSAIVPQRRGCNQGIWKELEKQTRAWADRYDDIYIVSGTVYQYPDKIPVVNNTLIAIPSHFYKIILVHNDKAVAMTAFLVPNDLSEKPLSAYQVSVDEIEKMTETDFFQNMLDDKEEEGLESTVNVSAFPLDHTFFRQRIEKWNAL